MVTISSVAAFVLLANVWGHLLAPQVDLVECRTIFKPTDDGDEGRQYLLPTQRDVFADSKQPVGMAAVTGALAGTRRRASLGLRQIQRRPEDVFGLRSASVNKRAWRHSLFGDALTTTRLWPDASLPDASNEIVGPEKRSPTRWPNQGANNGSNEHKFIYVISPISELVHPFQAERLAEGYKNLLPLSDGYAIGLQKMSGAELAGDFNQPLIGPEATSNPADVSGCRASRSLVQLTRDETDPISGRLLRQCAGSVELNTCEGSCPSGVQPSVKSPTGFAKQCACCSEGAFRRLQVRLNKCSTPNDELAAQTFMDIEVEEPIDCKCRRCDSLI